ncbi:ABC transporter substrate-binding protein [Thermosipho atlanticus]|uniref:Monosaccharide ABC transporter substrate-binding protein, CUT2 family (TC 3.A.1.2.-) n=1 Tax=Thermosipho atlanticus DSM 15807 TaxID=1123380 RepID=A0A1M5TW86_9BACT|nr:ABC transporter substrate-binding protein [Thermosipho atlanticus]SHH54866.1 monosaccharide ABC transporter substrate-binding protein, CUT2 family (TC 3.A.1.2.-) [Thermosipho atlanticus DSM 15807]
MKKILLLVFLGLFVISMSLNVFAEKAVSTKQMKVFFIVKASESEYWQIVLNGAEKAAKHFGVTLIHQEPTTEADVSKQVAILETAISTHPDAIVIAPTVADALVPGIEHAMKMGIPVIIIDSAANTDMYVSFLASNNYKIGQAAADKMAELLAEKNGEPKGEVALITFMSGVGSLEQRKAGFIDRLKEKYPKIKLVAVRDAQGKQGNTIGITQDLLTAFPNLDGIYASNQYTGDEMVRALDMMGRKDLATVAVDSGAQEVWGLKNGYLDAILVQRPWIMGYAGVAYAIMARNGVPLGKNIDTGIVVVTPEMLKSGAADEVLDPINYHKDW